MIEPTHNRQLVVMNDHILAWMVPVKGLLALFVLYVHVIDKAYTWPWFVAPNPKWPQGTYTDRLFHLVPSDLSPLWAVLVTCGWLGVFAPGVFIVLSGLGLTWSLLKGGHQVNWTAFFIRRAKKIYLAYWAISLTVILIYVFLGQDVVNTKTLWSVTGLKWRTDLFFYLSPPWWFIWTILQLYLLFPLLIWIMRRYGITALLIVSFAVTVAARSAGLVWIEDENTLHCYSLGMVALTRLLEFSTGIALGCLLHRVNDLRVNRAELLLSGIGLFAVGILLSISWTGTIFAPACISLGTLAILIVAWEWISHQTRWADAVRDIGETSYELYLVHEPLLNLVSYLVPLHTVGHVLGLIASALFSIPVAQLTSRIIQRLMAR